MPKRELIALHDNIVIKPAGKQEMVGFLHVPDNFQKKLSFGTVVDLAEGCTPQIQKGDQVTYHMHTGVDIDVDGEKYVVVSESQCIAIVREIQPRIDPNQTEMRLVK